MKWRWHSPLISKEEGSSGFRPERRYGKTKTCYKDIFVIFISCLGGGLNWKKYRKLLYSYEILNSSCTFFEKLARRCFYLKWSMVDSQDENPFSRTIPHENTYRCHISDPTLFVSAPPLLSLPWLRRLESYLIPSKTDHAINIPAARG